MKSNELRIGNYVLINGEIESVDGNDINYLDFNGNRYAPIPLTPEILEKAGFKHSEYQEYCNWERDMFCFNSDELKQCIHGRMLVTTVHQLQNLYFALTGEELPIEL